jgi:AcrR family transcriptional regulator
VPPRKGQRQARGLARQQQILDVAFGLFADHGYRATTLAQVADAVGITEAGVLHHFPSKEALLQAVLDARDLSVDPDVQLWIAEAGGGVASVRRMAALAQPLLDDPRLARFDAVVGGESVGDAAVGRDHFRDRLRLIRKSLAAMLADGVRSGEIRRDTDVDAVAAEITAFMNGIQTQWLLDPRKVNLRQAYDHYFGTLADTLEAR